MTKWEFCSIYPIEEYRHWLVPYGDGFKETFTLEGGKREEVPDDPHDLARSIAQLGEDGWELVGCGNVSEVRHALYFKRPKGEPESEDEEAD
jgi:hypothetical protein